MDILQVEGIFTIEHWRNNQMLKRLVQHNGIKNQGRAYLLNAGFSEPAISPQVMYIGLLNTGFTPNDTDDIYADISGWEFDEYTIGGGAVNRATWDTDTIGLETDGIDYRFIKNGTLIEYDVTGLGAAEAVYGIFVGGNQAKSDYSLLQTLWSTGAFSGGDITVDNGDTLKVEYKVRIPAA
jgi:hypothetical protein